MKLLQIPNYYHPHTGGIEQVARNIVRSLSDRDVEQRVVCFNEDAEKDGLKCNGGETKTDCIDGIEITRCGCQCKIASQSLSFSYPFVLKKVIDDFDPDVIVFHYPNPFVTSFLLPMIKKKARFIVFWNLDITKQKLLGKVFDHQTKKLLDRADAIVAASPNYIEGSKYLPYYKNKCIVIPNCVAVDAKNTDEAILSKAKEIRNIYKDKCICFTVGRHIPYKGFEYLIKASRYLNNDYVVLIGGKGPLTDRLKEMASGMDNVVFVGFLSDEELMAYYNACDIITFSSITKNEAFGISLAEGMGFGKPAVTFHIPGSGVNYVNLNDVSGIEVPNKDCKAYAEAIIRINCDRTLYNRYAKGAKDRVLQYFTYDTFKENIIDLLYENSSKQ